MRTRVLLLLQRVSGSMLDWERDVWGEIDPETKAQRIAPQFRPDQARKSTGTPNKARWRLLKRNSSRIEGTDVRLTCQCLVSLEN